MATSSSTEVVTESNSLTNLQQLLEARIQKKEIELKNGEERFQVLQQENLKLCEQVTSLKDHLSEIQKGHVQERLKADQKEIGLKQQLDDLQMKLLNAQTTQITQKQQVLGHLERKLEVMREERDDALLKMENAQEQANMNAESIKNLQTVLEQFQKDQSTELGQALKTSQLQLADALAKHQHLKAELKTVQEQLEEAQAAAQVSSILNQELEEKESKYALVMKENERLHTLLQESQHRLSSDERTQVDRNLVKNLVLGYIHATDHKKTEVLHLMSKILEFSDQELKQAVSGHSRGKGWLAGLWKTTPTSESDLAPTSLSQLFIKFLESESTSKTSTSNQAAAGYIDPLTDPDKPSLSTASLLGSVEQLQQEKPSKSTSAITSALANSSMPSANSPVSSQSSLLKSVLTD